MKTTVLGLICGLVVTVTGARVALAANCAWKGSGSGNGANFARTGNWSCGAIPGMSDDVYFDPTFVAGATNNACTFNAAVNVNSIHIQNGFTAAITGGGNTVTVAGTWVMSSASAISGMTGNVTVGGALSISAGSYGATSATTQVGGSFSAASGTFTAGGTVVLAGTSTLGTVTSNGNGFNALTINGSGGIYTLQDNLSLTGTLTITAGTLAGGAHAISVGGNWSNSGTFTGTGTVTLSGTSSAGTIKSGGSSLGALTVSGSGGTYTLQDGLSVTGALTMSTGTLTAGNNAVQVGSVSLSGGTFNLSSGTTQVAGAFSNGGGTFSANGGTVKLTGAGALSPGASSFNTLTISGSGTYTLGSTLLVGGNLTITTGTLAGGTWGITVGGSWSNTSPGAFTGSGTTTLSGTLSTGTIKSGGSSFGALTVNGSGGTYTLQDALSTSSDLTLTAGTLAASAFNVTVGGSFNVTSGAFTGGPGTVGITSNLALTGGTFTGGAGSETVGGNVSVSNSVTNGSDPTLVGYWTLDDAASPAVDASGNGNDLTWNGAPTATTAVPGAITFTDSHALGMTGGQYAGSAVLSGVPELAPATVTLSAWYRATSVDTNGSEIISGSNTYGLRITTTGLTVMKRISDNTSANDWIEYRVPESNLLDGNWHQIVGVILTGTGGGMSAYFDGVVAAGSYYVNGSASGNPKLLSASTTPTASAAAAAPIDWDANTETFGLVVGNNPSTTGYHFGGSAGGGSPACSGTACAIDDVRIYNRALTAAEVVALAHGNQPGSAVGVLSLAGSLTVTGGVTVQATGTLTLASGSTLGVGTALTMDGTLNATGGTIKAAASGTYAFKVGSTAAAAPNLNITRLAVQNTDGNGMWINANTSAVTTFTSFDNLAFSSGTGSQLLQIYASALYLSSNGCTFDGSTTYAVKLVGNGTNQTRALFGAATCAANTSGICATSEKSDDDANNDGIPDSPGNGVNKGAVVQFVRAAEADANGTLVGFPTAAFDWNSFTYYSTYVTFHDASGGSDVIYVRDEAGNPLYSWTNPTADETITGTPQWTTVSGTHYLYVSVNGGSSNSGKVYRLKDTGTGTTSGTLTVDASWATSGAYACSCTITSGLSLDPNNIYWAATTASSQVLMGLNQSSGAKISTSWPVTTPANVTTSSPTLSTVSGTTTLYLGVTADLLQLAVTGTTFVQNTKPGTITGRVSFGTSYLAATNGTSRVYAGDTAGNMTAISPTNFTGTNFLWSYAAGGAITNNYYDGATDTLAFGTSGGKVVVLNAAGSGTGGSLLNTTYPYTLNDPITAAPLYVNGVLAVATTLGKLYLLDRNTGLASPNGVSILQQYSFGPTESVSTIGFDANQGRYMVSTSSAANDGRLYYFDGVADPTPTFQ